MKAPPPARHPKSFVVFPPFLFSLFVPSFSPPRQRPTLTRKTRQISERGWLVLVVRRRRRSREGRFFLVDQGPHNASFFLPSPSSSNVRNRKLSTLFFLGTFSYFLLGLFRQPSFLFLAPPSIEVALLAFLPATVLPSSSTDRPTDHPTEAFDLARSPCCCCLPPPPPPPSQYTSRGRKEGRVSNHLAIPTAVPPLLLLFLFPCLASNGNWQCVVKYEVGEKTRRERELVRSRRRPPLFLLPLLCQVAKTTALFLCWQSH